MRITSNNHLGWIVLVLCAPAIGCAAEAPVNASAGDLLETDAGPLDPVGEEETAGADPGCEGRLVGGERFAIVSGEPGLVAAVGANGEVVCVDTVEAVEEELAETGREEDAQRLLGAYQAAMASGEAADKRLRRATREGDPDPEPNIDFHRFRLPGDPDPEPNTGA